MSPAGMDEALRAFLVESAENLARLEGDLVQLEQSPDDSATLASIFRSVHTIKGTCGFFGFNRVEGVTHVAEDVLVLVRDGRLAFSRELTSALFELVDAVRHMLSLIEQDGHDGDNDYPTLVATFRGFLGAVPEAAPVAEPVHMEEADRSSAVAESAIRVDVGLLDKLMNVVGELVLTRNQILQYTGAQSDPVLTRASQRLNLVTAELQESVMKTRMQPISTVWGAFPRLVRDLELHTGKRVRLEREGGDTELDRSLLQAIKDPLTHLVRNAVDHGLEKPEQRARAGKKETGTVLLRAFHESGYVILEISDDGMGVDTAAVLDRAITRGLVRAEQAVQLGEREVLDLLFLPGFSTAAQVTNISGRGVGLDVVRNNVERVGGSVDIQTRPGEGTTFKIKMPLTLAIIPALVTTCHDERYAIPQVNLLEIVRLAAEDLHLKIEHVHDSLVYRLRGKLLPLVDLRRLLTLPPRGGDASVYILVLLADNREYGLIVDSVRDTEEIVVKPLGRHLKSVNCFAGATIMGDGRVALILDAMAIAQRAHVLTESQRGSRRTQTKVVTAGEDDKRQSFLLFRMSAQGYGAIPLASVQRLEEIDAAKIEFSCNQEVIQYRQEILPLVRLNRLLNLPEREAEEGGMLQVVVHQSESGSVGVVVDHIIDIVDDEIKSVTRQGLARRAILGSAVVQGRITDLIDMDRIIDLSLEAIYPAEDNETAGEIDHE